MDTEEYAPGRRIDSYGSPSDPSVLLWHGMQADSRSVLRPLAETIARHRVAVAVPDWDSHAADRGRADLLRSIDFVRERCRNPHGLVLVGWSMGGLAAAGMAFHAKSVGMALSHTVCLAGAFTADDPISGGPLTEDVAAAAVSPFTLLHGLGDDVVPVATSRAFAGILERAGRQVDLVEIDADHGSIAGARHRPEADRYVPAYDTGTLGIVGDVAARIVAVTPR